MYQYHKVLLCIFVYLLPIWRTINLSSAVGYEGAGTPCYDEKGKAQRCIPQFENAAFGLEVEATNTCGQNGPTEYCVQTSTSGIRLGCDFCNSSQTHSPYYMTDFSSTNSTWWQSDTMNEGIQAPNQVNLTLHFGKSFDTTYIQLLFKSPRPHSFAILKKKSEDGPWIPFQYYSANCTEMYSMPEQNSAERGEFETRSFCSSQFSDISPLSDGSVLFASLAGRPSASEYDYRPEFWDWVTVTDIRITLDRLNTFGDEIFKSPAVLKSYFYAISDFAVGARCKCNGHAEECLKSSASDGRVRRICRCEHNTAGPDCNECLPFYNDAPWHRGSNEDAHECRACNCNGLSQRCFFDKELYALTGHGGHCLECANNRDGPNCERCRPNYYQSPGEIMCFSCNCNDTGSWNLQCNSEGKCSCKPGITGDKCDKCDNNYYDFGSYGCKECGCNVAGSYYNRPFCDSRTGTCVCKENVEGKQCSNCKPGFFNLDESDEFGCTPCFCYGHSSICRSASGYSKVPIESSFVRGNEKWKAETIDGHNVSVSYNTHVQALEAISSGRDSIYFVASERFLGDQRASYNHDLSFKLRISDTSPMPSVTDVVLEGAGLSISQTIFGQGNPLPTTNGQKYKFRLHENSDYGWQPHLTARDFMSLLAHLTAIKIRGTYTPQGVGFLDEVSLETARRGAAGYSATWVEMCTCPEGYIGQYCESCAPGSRHEPVSGGAFAPCVPCNCNQHAKICDADTGRCICEHNTAGENCDRCARGFYGNPLVGTPSDCKPCPCPNRGACTLIGDDDTIVCLECPKGYGGPKCDSCDDGYFGDPTSSNGPVSFCQPCDCNSNIDTNAIGNCNRTTGECLKCIHNTGGFHCDQCLPGYYGEALAGRKGDCKPCMCYPLGTIELESNNLNCDQLSGQCKCKPHVTGNNCDECEPGYYDLDSGQGCQTCNCDPIGAVNHTCNIQRGQCNCRPGVTGLRCDKCLPYHYGFSLDGCKPCECDTIGSTSLQCDTNGQCPCLQNVEGRRCDRCKENKYDRQRDCIDCAPCYNLVKDAADLHREDLHSLEQSISNISNSDSISLDDDFEENLKTVYSSVEKLANDVRSATSGENDGKVTSAKLNDLHKKLDEISIASKDIANVTRVAKSTAEKAEVNVTAAEQNIEHAQRSLSNAEEYLFTDGKSALSKAINKSKEVGEQNQQMSQIARDARALVQKQEEGAEALRETADSARKSANEAYSIAVQAINKQKNITEELKQLNSTLIFTGEKLNVTVDQINAVKDQAALAHAEALSIYRDVYALNVPTIDIAGVKENASNFMRIASENQARAEKLLSENKNLLLDVNGQINSAEGLLPRGIQQQQIADEFLANVDSARTRAEDAVKLGDKTLQEAQQTYVTLQEFNNVVQESKVKATEALKQIPEIVKLMDETLQNTEKVGSALANAETNAQYAKETAEDAEKKYAKKASEEAYEIRNRAEATLSAQNNLIDKVKEVKNRVSETSNEVDSLKQTAKTDHDVIFSAKEKVGQAKTHANEVRKQVETAAEEIDKIIKELNNLPEIDEASLNRLTQKLEVVEKQFNESKIEEELDSLRKNRYIQIQQAKSYQEELDRLQKDVANLDNIRSALPVGCFKRDRLEH